MQLLEILGMKQNKKPLPKCRCDKWMTKHNYHYNGCKYAIEFNKQLLKQ